MSALHAAVRVLGAYAAPETVLSPAVLAAVELEAAAEDYLRAADDLTRRGLFDDAAELLAWHERTVRVAARGGGTETSPRAWIEHEVDILFEALVVPPPTNLIARVALRCSECVR